jgi:hypothetical protein
MNYAIADIEDQILATLTRDTLTGTLASTSTGGDRKSSYQADNLNEFQILATLTRDTLTGTLTIARNRSRLRFKGLSPLSRDKGHPGNNSPS